jgi:hypothetical protein
MRVYRSAQPHVPDPTAAERFANNLRARKERRGYVVLPEQVPLL